MVSRPTLARLTRQSIPWLLLSVRVAMVPLLIFAPRWLTDRILIWFYVIAFITDYFDGALARAFHTAGPGLRKADSAADTVFQLAVASLILRRHPDVFHHSATALAIFLISSAIWYTLDAIRWRRVAGFHAYSAKIFSCALLTWMLLFLSGVHTGPLLGAVLIVGSISNVECILISLRLKKDRCDVPTIFRASSRPK